MNEKFAQKIDFCDTPSIYSSLHILLNDINKIEINYTFNFKIYEYNDWISNNCSLLPISVCNASFDPNTALTNYIPSISSFNKKSYLS